MSNNVVIYSHQGTTSTGAGSAIEISSTVTVEPVIFVEMIGEGEFTVNVEGSADAIRWVPWTSGYTSSVAKKLPLGVRFWRTNIVSNGGSVYSYVGESPDVNGGWHAMNHPTTQNPSQT